MPSEDQRQKWRDEKRGYYAELSPEQRQKRQQANQALRERKRSQETPEQTEARRARYREIALRHRERDRDSYNEKRRVYGRKRALELRTQVLAVLGDRCDECGFDDWRALQIHHINGGGGKHRRSSGGYHYFRAILNDISKYQLLCANCHMIKSYREEHDEVAL